ncbi:hypothetical protein HAX54_025739 [Datura stramonium]|uniref:Uncharacterized protein n=1 Tax=Datura stramonium TaxID=4076 RepID=A0ABS8V042_DATST|nr:hypothetical protein [Datura stramonium]
MTIILGGRKHMEILLILQTLVDAAGPISTKISKVTPQGCSNATPKISNSLASMKSSRGESTSSHEVRCWKTVRSYSNKSGDADLAVVEIPNSVDSPSRTLTVPFKEKFISELWSVIRGKLFGRDVDCASSLKEEVQVILEEMDGKDVDVPPLLRLMKSFFELVALYDQARSTLHDKDMEASLSEVKKEIEKLHRKEKDLEVLLEATQKEFEEAKLGVSTAEKDLMHAMMQTC